MRIPGLVFAVAALLTLTGLVGVPSGAARPTPAPPPTGPTVTHVYPYSLTNAHPKPTGVYEQLVVIDPAVLGSTYLAANLSNTQWSYPNGTLIPSWIESNATLSATATMIWLKIQWSIPAYGATTVYLDCWGASFMLSEKGPSGEAPLLSSSYGKFDDGWQVFPFYQNFSGTSLSAGWTLVSGTTSTVSNGWTVGSSNGGYGIASWPMAFTNNTALVANYTYTTSQAFVLGLTQTRVPFSAGHYFTNGYYVEGEATTGGVLYSTATTASGIATFAPAFSMVSGDNYRTNLTWSSGGRAVPMLYGQSNGPTVQSVAGVSSATYTSLYANTTYVVMAIYDGGAETIHYWFVLNLPSWGIEPTVATGAIQAPAAPTNVGATATSVSTVVLTFAPSTSIPVVNYTVAYGTALGTPGHWLSAGVGVSIYGNQLDVTISGLTANATYYFTIQSWVGTVESSPSMVVSARTFATGPSKIISNGTLSATGTSLTTIVLVWQPPQNVTPTNYSLYASVTYHATFVGFGTGASEGLVTTATVAGLTANTTYYFVVASWTSATLRGPPSNVIVAHTLSGLPPDVRPPVLTAVGATVSSVNASWSAGANITEVNYTLLWGRTYGLYSGSASVGVVLHATATGLAVNATYYFLIETWTSATVRGPSSNIAVAHTLESVVNGRNGTNGHNGTNGTTGPPGPTGPIGPPGHNGTNGRNGTNGHNGTNGTTGPTGPRGPQGVNGTNGVSGINGTNGTAGARGPGGPSGIPGSIGPPGPAGILSWFDWLGVFLLVLVVAGLLVAGARPRKQSFYEDHP